MTTNTISWRQLSIAALTASGMAFCLPAAAQEQDGGDADDDSLVEEIIVTGERGEIKSIDRAMTVTGWNADMIQKLGIQNINDMEVLVTRHAGR